VNVGGRGVLASPALDFIAAVTQPNRYLIRWAGQGSKLPANQRFRAARPSTGPAPPAQPRTRASAIVRSTSR
jgi:hypothetical protein